MRSTYHGLIWLLFNLAKWKKWVFPCLQDHIPIQAKVKDVPLPGYRYAWGLDKVKAFSAFPPLISILGCI